MEGGKLLWAKGSTDARQHQQLAIAARCRTYSRLLGERGSKLNQMEVKYSNQEWEESGLLSCCLLLFLLLIANRRWRPSGPTHCGKPQDDKPSSGRAREKTPPPTHRRVACFNFPLVYSQAFTLLHLQLPIALFLVFYGSMGTTG